MLPQTQQRKKKNSSKVNLTISLVFHGVLVAVLLYFAAREGLLGTQIKKITAEMVKEKPPEKPKEPEKPKVEPPKVDTPKLQIPKVEEAKAPPPAAAAPVVAPANADAPTFEFSDGAKAVTTENDPVQLYKGYIEYVLRSRWNRPENLPDDNFTVEVAVTVDKQGNLSPPQWLKGSGNTKWDDSVKNVFKTVTVIDRRPPTNFPSTVTIRFDVEQLAAEPVLMQ